MRVAVIGAGIIGATAALALCRRGHEVTLFDRSGGAESAALGNAGAFAFSDIIPLATPGIMARAPRWLLDPDGPLSVPPAYLPAIAPWLWRFWRASRPSRYEAAVRAQGALMDLSRRALERLVTAEGLEPLLRREGQLQLFDSARSLDDSLPGWEARKAAGIRFELIRSAADIAAIQPGLHPRFTHAAWTPDWFNVTDPAVWTRRITDLALGAGARMVASAVTALGATADGVRLSVAGEAPERFDRAVLAAGAWSRPLARQVGPDLPLETERGYNTTLPAGAFDLRTHLTFHDHGFVVTRIGAGVRIGGAVELAGLRRPPRMSRAAVLLRKAQGFLPGLRATGGKAWMGFRPSMPDSLPVIAPAARAPGVVIAFGHGHLGLTQSAGTAEIVADLIDGRRPAIDISPFAATRFSRSHG